MIKVKDMNELYINELRDLYSAETQIVKALPMMLDAAVTPKLKNAINSHLNQTKRQVERLETIFSDLEVMPVGPLMEGGEVLGEVEMGPVRDAAIIGAAQRVEHYEIAAYGTARTFAELLGFTEHAALLQQTLDEEFEADATLTQLAIGEINDRAMQSSPVNGGR